MSSKTKIQWADETWNPTTGCSRVSEGCRHCYIERTPPMRMAGRKLGDPVQLHPERLDAPLHWRKPRRVFVNSMSDLFHEAVPDEFIDQVFDAMVEADQHGYQVLTKRPQRMQRWVTNYLRHLKPEIIAHVWLGVSVEDQRTADERIPILLATPAAVRWVSAEPLLGPVDLCHSDMVAVEHFLKTGQTIAHGLDWVVVGGESGPQARPTDLAWIRSIVRQCQAAGIPVFVKQLGSRHACEHDRKGGCWDCLPGDIKFREFPYVRYLGY